MQTEFLVPQRSEKAIRVMWWIRSSQIIIALIPILFIVLEHISGFTVGPVGSLCIGVALLFILWLATDMIRFYFHARRVQKISLTHDHLHYTTLTGRARPFPLDDVEQVIIAPREFSIGNCADLLILSRASKELQRVLVMYDRPVVAEVAQLIEQHREPLP